MAETGFAEASFRRELLIYQPIVEQLHAESKRRRLERQ
jgi:hypothetical protein